MRVAKMLPAGPAPMTQTLAMTGSRGHPSELAACYVRLGRQPQIGFETIMQPAADVVAGRPSAADHFVMAATAAEGTRPAGPAGFLAVNGPRGEPIGLTGGIDAVVERAHRAFLVTDKAVAGGKLAFGGDAEIAGAGAAGVGAVGAAMDFAHGVHHVGERIAPPRPRSALIFPPAIDHFAQHQLEIPRLHFARF